MLVPRIKLRVLGGIGFLLSLSLADHHHYHDYGHHAGNNSYSNYWQNQYASQNKQYDYSNPDLYATQGQEGTLSNWDATNYYAQDYPDYNEPEASPPETNILGTLVEQYRKFGRRIIDRVGGVDRQAFAFLANPGTISIVIGAILAVSLVVVIQQGQTLRDNLDGRINNLNSEINTLEEEVQQSQSNLDSGNQRIARLEAQIRASATTPATTTSTTPPTTTSTTPPTTTTMPTTTTTMPTTTTTMPTTTTTMPTTTTTMPTTTTTTMAAVPRQFRLFNVPGLDFDTVG